MRVESINLSHADSKTDLMYDEGDAVHESIENRKDCRTRTDIAQLEDIPNIGRSIADDLRQLGIQSPDDLPGRDPYKMYEDLCRITGQRHDPCLLDTFIAAVRFMEGAPEETVVEIHG